MKRLQETRIAKEQHNRATQSLEQRNQQASLSNFQKLLIRSKGDKCLPEGPAAKSEESRRYFNVLYSSGDVSFEVTLSRRMKLFSTVYASSQSRQFISTNIVLHKLQYNCPIESCEMKASELYLCNTEILC